MINKMLRKFILVITITTVFAAFMLSIAIYGIAGTVSAYGAQNTQEKSTEASETKAVSGSPSDDKNSSSEASVSSSSDGSNEEVDFFSKDKMAETIVRLIFVGIVIGIVIISFWLLKGVFKRYQHPTDPNLKSKSTVMLIIYSCLRFLIAFVAVLIILSVFGVNISGAFAALGIAGAAGALAVQDLLKDVIMGVTIVSDQYFQLGDIVDYNGFQGKILEINMRTTKIESLKDKSIMSIRNSNITEVLKLSRQINITVPLPYELPLKRGLEILNTIVERCKELELVEDAIAKGPNAFNDSSIDYLLFVFCDPATLPNTKRAVYMVIMQYLEEVDVHIPFPQRDIHIIK